MKRNKRTRALVSLLLALLLVATAILPAFAGENSVKNCNHQYAWECQVSWSQYYNQSYHKNYTGNRFVCVFCGVRYVETIEALTQTEAHSYGALQYIRSDHSSSNPANHYYVKQRICPVCYGAYETHTYSTGCTSSGCVDPQGFSPIPVTE